MSNNIFRKSSLDRLSSPEQLDSLVKVTNSKGWVGLIGILVIIAVAIIWSFQGSIATQLHGEGVLVSSDGLQIVNTPNGGQITDVSVSPGDRIEEGDVVARVEAPEARSNVRQTAQELSELEEQLLEEGGTAEKRQELGSEIARLKAERDSQTDELLSESRVISPYSGRVTEVLIESWDYVAAGTSAVMIEPEGEDIVNLEGVFYVPATEAPRLNPGMEVRITPSGIDKETYGYLEGRINEVGSYPATNEGMMQVLNNESLVQRLSGEEVMVEVRVDLVPSGDNPSGYSWSISNGPPFQMNNGTLSSGEVVISETSPIQTFFLQQ
ncbi:NHLP bacteriocin system secretion protein [Salibacterium sp. K-3]